MLSSSAANGLKSSVQIVALVLLSLIIAVPAGVAVGATDPSTTGSDKDDPQAEPLQGTGWEVDYDPSGSGTSGVITLFSGATAKNLADMVANERLQRELKSHHIVAMDLADSDLAPDAIVALFQRLPEVKELRDGGPIIVDGRYATGMPFNGGSIGGGGLNFAIEPAAISEAELAAIAKITDLEVLRIGGQISDASIAHFKALTNLRVLHIRDGKKFTGAGLAHLQGLKKLESLVLPGADLNDAGLENLKYFPQLTELSLGIQPEGLPYPKLNPQENGVHFDGLSHVSGLHNLRRLQMTGLGLNDFDLGPLRELTKLEHLELDNLPNMTGLGLTSLQTLTNLRSLTLRDVPARTRGLKSLRFLSRLEEVRLENNDLSDGGARCLTGLSNLRRLRIADQQGFDWSGGHANEHTAIFEGTGLSDALKTMPKLEDLDISECYVSDSVMPGMSSLTSLKRLQLSSTGVDNDGLRYLEGLKQLEELDIYQGSGAPTVGDEGMKHLKRLTRLRELSLSAPTVTDKGLAQLEGLAELRRLSLDAGTNITDAGLEHLAKLRKLTELSLGETKATVKGLQFLHDHCPTLEKFQLDRSNGISHGEVYPPSFSIEVEADAKTEQATPAKAPSGR